MKNYFDISGKKVIVTGGTRGIGKDIAEGYCEQGCEVVFIGSNKERLEKTVAENVAKGYKAYAVVADLTDLEQVDRAYYEALELLGGVIDVMVPNAGMQSRHPIEEFPIEDFIKVQKLNVLHVYRMAQLAATTMLKQEGRGNGKIITIGSAAGCFTAGHNISAYTTSKGAVLNLTKGICESVAARNININCVCPGYFPTEILDTMDPELKAAITGKIPARRMGTKDDLVGVMIFLASAASDYMNGSAVLVDGGQAAVHA